MCLERTVLVLAPVREGAWSGFHGKARLVTAWLMHLVIFALCTFTAITEAATSPEWIQGEGFRFTDLAVPSNGRTFLQELQSSETGIAFRSDVPEERGAENSIRLAGTGVAAGDIDGDGWCDLFFCSMGGKSALYRNLGGWKFQDITEQAGVGLQGQDSTGAVLSDVDGDGDLDLLVNSIGGGTRLFLNDGKGRFVEAVDSGLLRRGGSISMTLADVDGNGTLDLYVVNYAKTKLEDRPNTKVQSKTVNGQIVITALDGVPTTSPELTNRYYVDADRVIRERGEPDVLYLNDGHGKFTAASWTGGAFLDDAGKPLTLPPYDWGLSAMFRDLNGDGSPDLYVCNDLFSPDRIWINDGHGHFRAINNLAVRQTSMFSMGIDFADINRDGYDDFLVLDMLSPKLAEQKVQTVGVRNLPLPVGKIDNRPQYKRNTLSLNRGDGTYAEIGQLSGLDATGWSWSPLFVDLDLDGFEDLLVTTGYYRDALNADAVTFIKLMQGKRKLTDQELRELKKRFPKLPQQNRAFRNRGDLTFEDMTKRWGFDYFGISQAICLADLDNDGDFDVVLVRQNGPVAIYRNETSAGRLAVRLRGKAPNTHGIGARIRLLGGPVPQSQDMICGGRYLASDDAIRTFATGKGTNLLSIEVTWPGGARIEVRDVRANRLYEISQLSNIRVEKPEVDSDTKRRDPGPLFEDVSGLLNHSHAETEFNDFLRQPTLTHKLSQLGPGVSWFDLDGDGLEDLIIGSGKGGSLAVFHNKGGGLFSRLTDAALAQATARDQTTVLGFNGPQTHASVIVGLSNYEDGSTNGAMVTALQFGSQSWTDLAPAQLASVGPMALGDLNGDGELDLFAGGRAVSGRYPEAASSLLLHGHSGRWALDKANTARLAEIGLVSGAVFSDLDGDGYPELILACQWGPLRVFHNEHGQLNEITAQLGLQKYRGLWNGVAVGDLDGDGRMDLVASNWGRNTKYQSAMPGPIRYYYGESAEKMFLSVIASYDTLLNKWVARCGMANMLKALPDLEERFKTHTAYSTASVEEILSPHLPNPKILEANWLDTTVFLNRGDHFEARPLPTEAQFAPAFGISVADFDGDGFEDIFLSQNFSAVDNETARYDSGRGLLLRGDGHADFKPLPGQVSGIQIYGEQRGCAVADYDSDGRPDLVVTQNGSATKLYHNVRREPGLRVRLEGMGIGAVIRLIHSGQMGPAREIHAGQGYWSQDGAVQVMNASSPPAQIWVRWPGGKTITNDIPTASKELLLKPDGTSQRLR